MPRCGFKLPGTTRFAGGSRYRSPSRRPWGADSRGDREAPAFADAFSRFTQFTAALFLKAEAFETQRV